MRVGFIGLGSMGGSQARQLAKTVPELVVYDAFPIPSPETDARQ